MAAQKQSTYRSYLLRLWREGHNRQPLWRASLESAQSREVYHFASVEALFAFLRQQIMSEDRRDEDLPLL
jgi:hypothetical protein